MSSRSRPPRNRGPYRPPGARKKDPEGDAKDENENKKPRPKNDRRDNKGKKPEQKKPATTDLLENDKKLTNGDAKGKPSNDIDKHIENFWK